MKTINGMRFFNGTPHPIRFQDRNGVEVVVEPDEVINARPVEMQVKGWTDEIEFVRPEFEATDEGWNVIYQACEQGAQIILGSIIAAQAYPGEIVGIIQIEGQGRCAPAERIYRSDKFSMF